MNPKLQMCPENIGQLADTYKPIGLTFKMRPNTATFHHSAVNRGPAHRQPNHPSIPVSLILAQVLKQLRTFHSCTQKPHSSHPIHSRNPSSKMVPYYPFDICDAPCLLLSSYISCFPPCNFYEDIKFVYRIVLSTVSGT